MNWGGNTIYTEWNYRPLTKLAIKWSKTADGNWTSLDRGATEDVYESSILFRGPESELSDLETFLGNNRNAFDITVGTGEEIFGADVDHSGTLSVTVTDYGEIKRASFGAYTMPLRLRLFSPSFTGSASFSNLRIDDFNYQAGSSFDITKSFSYDGSATYMDGETDPGIFAATFRQTHAEMKEIRRYLTTTARTASVSFPSFGVSEPFGQRMGTGPFNTKIIKWEDMGRSNLIDWRINITFSRVI